MIQHAMGSTEMDIATTRLHIRDVIEADADALHLLRTDPLVYRYNHFGPETLAQTRHWLERTMYHNARTDRDSHNCAIVLRDSGEVIGWLGFGFSHPEQKPIGDVGIGYAIRPHAWGQGFTTEALRATLNYIFQETPAEHARAYCDVQNVASARDGKGGYAVRSA
jgi:ribosomal-protein-alanine N-acetyltransferase